jgi:hypothetical protein
MLLLQNFVCCVHKYQTIHDSSAVECCGHQLSFQALAYLAVPEAVDAPIVHKIWDLGRICFAHNWNIRQWRMFYKVQK